MSERMFDPVDYLDTPEACAEFLTAALEEDDPVHFRNALDVVARARGLQAGADKASSISSTSEGEDLPPISNLSATLRKLGLELAVKVA